MSYINDGGPAFPNALATPTNDGYLSTQGASLRDYFAAKAPPYPEDWFNNYCRERGFTSRSKALADWAYEYADAMLAARQPRA